MTLAVVGLIFDAERAIKNPSMRSMTNSRGRRCARSRQIVSP